MRNLSKNEINEIHGGMLLIDIISISLGALVGLISTHYFATSPQPTARSVKKHKRIAY